MTGPTTVLDLFAGVGGASYGLALAGFDVLGVEFWREAVQAHRTHGPCLEADLSTDDWMGGLPHLSWDGVWSSFPCQARSNAGKRLGAKDPRNGWPWTVKCLRELRARGQARWFLAENVKGLLQHATSKGCKEGARLGGDDCPGCYFETVILVDLRDLFPVVDYRVLDAADFGVPQHRHRLILWGGPVPFRWPSGGYSGAALAWARWGPEAEGGGDYWRSVGIPPVGGPSKEEERALRRARGGDPTGMDLRPWRTMRQALGLGEGGPWVETRKGVADRPSPTIVVTDGAGLASAATRRATFADAPAPTVTTTEEKGTRASEASSFTMNGGPDRASDALWLSTGRRRLEPVECAVLQAFDEGDGALLRAVASLPTKSAQYKAVGNAVPPTLAKVLGLAVLRTLQPP